MQDVKRKRKTQPSFPAGLSYHVSNLFASLLSFPPRDPTTLQKQRAETACIVCPDSSCRPPYIPHFSEREKLTACNRQNIYSENTSLLVAFVRIKVFLIRFQ